MKRRIADAIYWVAFPGGKVKRYSWPLWRALPLFVVDWVSRNYSPEPEPVR